MGAGYLKILISGFFFFLRVRDIVDEFQIIKKYF